ncbi:MAG TPA: DUF4157 domain-containing protein [Blastocatellia bacterium]|nr:DUF4157 domain-containing protein [Blastocatellia bacterium]
MEGTLTTKSEAPKHAHPEPAAMTDDVSAERHEMGASAGVPLFLQTSFLSSTPPTLPHRMTAADDPAAARSESLPIQPKLFIGQPGDAYEQEADQVAERVTRGGVSTPSKRAASPVQKTNGHHLQRKCATCSAGQTCEDCQARNRTDDTHRSDSPLLNDSGGEGIASPRLHSTMVSSGAGAPLSEGMRSRIEPALNADLSDVRVHSDPSAQSAAAEINARAFTHKNHIWLGSQQSADDVTLMAHEATHTVQQKAQPGPRIQRFLWAHTQHPNQPAYPTQHLHPTSPDCDQRALAAIDNEVVELKGRSDFAPSGRLSEGIWCFNPDPVMVRAQFGTLARGVLRVRVTDTLPTVSAPGTRVTPPLILETASDNEFLELNHPSFPGGGFDYPPRLYITIRNSIVTGNVSFFPGLGRVHAVGTRSWLAGYSLERLLGWRGLRGVTAASEVNELRDGVLRVALNEFQFQIDDTTVVGGLQSEGPDSLGGTGNFSVVDEAESFSANVDVRGDGINAGSMPLRKTSDRISGSGSFTLNLAPTDAFGGRFTGSIEGNFAGGMLTLQGTASYRSRRVNGNLTLLFAPRFFAWTRVSEVLPAATPNAPQLTIGASSAPGYVVVGWGTVDFALNEWLTGSVSAVLDPDGFITSHGILRPTREFQFLTDEERWTAATQIGDTLEGSVTIIPVAGFFDLGGHIEASLFAEGRVGPGRVYDLEVQGTFSTRPGSVFEASATGRINLSAWGRLRAEVSGGLHFSVAGDVVRIGSVDVKGTGTATVRAYVELQPTFERIANPAEPDTANYRITGQLTAAGAADIGLSGRVVIKVAGLEVWTVNLGRYQWNLGSLGMTATVSHVLGSHDPLEISYGSAEFDDAHFSSVIENLINRRGDRNDRGHDAELEQGAATRPPERLETPTEIERRFSMNGAPHRLWLEHDPAAVIKMASNGDDRLSNKLQAEATTVEQQQQEQSGDAAQELSDEAAEARRLLGQTQAVERSLNALQSESREAGDVAGFEELADGLTTYGTQFQKTDLATVAAPPPSAVEIVDGRYVITNQAQLDAVRAIQPQQNQPPAGMDPQLQAIWDRYSSTDPEGYFAERLRLIGQDLARPGRRGGTTSREGPQIWEAYVRARAKFDELRAAKDFQPELRDLILGERPGLDPGRVEIDVGLKPTRPGVPKKTGFADVVVTDVPNREIEVYSAKVHNVRAAAVGRSDSQVEQWIDQTMASDVDNAAETYGYEVEFRRPRVPTSEGRAGQPGSARHPLFEERIYVDRVNLVWRYSSDLIPGRFIPDILDAGEEAGVRQRRRSRVQVRFLLRPEPPTNPTP